MRKRNARKTDDGGIMEYFFCIHFFDTNTWSIRPLISPETPRLLSQPVWTTKNVEIEVVAPSHADALTKAISIMEHDNVTRSLDKLWRKDLGQI
jgi:hypothetical protein